VTDYEFHIKRLEQSHINLVGRRDRLIDQINSIFSNVTRIGGISLREASVIDDYGTDEERAEARSLETDTHWSEVDIQELDPGGSCMSFVDPIGYRYYLPAYMIYSLRNAFVDYPESSNLNCNAMDTTIYGLNASGYDSKDLCEHVRNKYTNFTQEERTCIARFLAFDAECVVYEDETDSIDALKNEWIGSLPYSELNHLQSIWPSAFS